MADVVPNRQIGLVIFVGLWGNPGEMELRVLGGLSGSLPVTDTALDATQDARALRCHGYLLGSSCLLNY